MKKVIITVGIPGSGKSTWAKNYIDTHEEKVEIIERDQIREEVQEGYYKQKPDRKVERQVTSIAKERLISFLSDKTTETVIISDTNLDRGSRVDLVDLIFKTSSLVSVVIKVLSDSRDLDLCLTRNRNREKVVPEEVVIKFWKQYMSEFEPEPFENLTDKKLIFVGDIHGQVEKLENLLSFYGPIYYHFVFLGDINDSRKTVKIVQEDSFLKTYRKIRSLVESGDATLIHSNHQKNLINAIRGKRKNLSHGLEDTLIELESANLLTFGSKDGKLLGIKPSREALNIANWLDTRPYYFKRGNIVGVHAQYLKDELKNPYSVSKKGLEALIYGTRKKVTNERVFWWETYEGEEYVVAGHYHEVFNSPTCAIIDGGCGCDEGVLLGFNPESNEVESF